MSRQVQDAPTHVWQVVLGSPPGGLPPSCRMAWLPKDSLSAASDGGRSCQSSQALCPETHRRPVLPPAIGQNKSQVQPRFKGQENRLHFLMRGPAENLQPDFIHHTHILKYSFNSEIYIIYSKPRKHSLNFLNWSKEKISITKLFFQMQKFSLFKPRECSFVIVIQLLSHVQLFSTPWTVACQAPLSMGFTRQEYWSRLPFPSPGYLGSGGGPSVSVLPSLL